MKRKGIVLLVLAVLLVGGIFALRGRGITVGRCFAAENGSILLVDGTSPIRLSDRTGTALSADLSTGDKILVLHDGVNETYPGSTGAYLCLRLGGGDLWDLDSETVGQLIQMGWIPVLRDEMVERYTGTVTEYTAVYGDDGNYLLRLQTETGERTLTVIQQTAIVGEDTLSVGDRVSLICTAVAGETYRPVLYAEVTADE